VGIATPTEAAATGAVGSLILAGIYKGLNARILKNALTGTLRVTVMVFMIISASQTYSAILAFTGATGAMVRAVSGLGLPPIATVMMMMLILLILGTFVEQVSMMMITVPIFMPIIESFGYDPIWFALLVLLNIEMGMSTPPFGMLLFVMKGSAPQGTSLQEIIVAALPFLACDLLLLILLLLFPSIVLFLPSLM
jgi:tripartite ATP-independent transporter DctM subunit